MGCGASNTAQPDPDALVEAEPKEEKDSKKSRHDRHLNKVTSKLGNKAIVNSFVVQKSRSRRRESDTGNPDAASSKIPEAKKNFADRGSFKERAAEQDAGAFHLPAENAGVAEPGLQGLSLSGPSFKMARGNQASILKELGKADSQNGAAGAAAAAPTKLVDVEKYKSKLYSKDDKTIMEGVTYFREQLSVVNPPVGAVRQSGIIPRLVQLLNNDKNRKLQYEVAWTLTNICSAEHDDCQDVVDQNAIPEFIRLLDSCDDAEVLEQAIWALGNIAADCKDLQKLVLEEGVVDPLLHCIKRNMARTSLLRQSAWLLSNLCRPKPQLEELYAAVPIIKSILEQSSDNEVTTHACWALAYISGAEEALEEILEQQEVLKKLVSFVSQSSSSMTTPCLRVLGNLCSGTSTATQAVVDAGGVPAILACLKSSERMSVKKECIWSLSNIAAGTSEQVQALVDANVFGDIIALMRTAEDSVRRECTYVLANPWASSVSVAPKVALALLDHGLVQELVALLNLSTPANILIVAIEGLQDAIKKGQQIMMWQAKEKREQEAAKKAAEPAAAGGDAVVSEDSAPPEPEQNDEAPSNPVAAVMKELGALDRLVTLREHEDDGITSKVNGMVNMLQFM
mmetsp:Transcript_2329/g.5203  ORF Transcript_2329/g.5203 Transcript_2329/m.5203 type:complete len:626 (+) Transcript_2329:275-2152(+)|eukprot:CAMPEP_0202920274 /NCGR_PEP_ID=MMETSP1392-20130828/76769_1 /ASSEMBLY_ACC=CAM_ASM_000868 /TAXON_ID=225041 /ORGANISM="Chlamydomonas chlamydogama, Strain SAG 11-48b" /LENGTH=625 /DNA_ID=CAMNT_0049613759 /DNA_START=275 /DNA_END=2152 /DNA_ORIENTATION=+